MADKLDRNCLYIWKLSMICVIGTHMMKDQHNLNVLRNTIMDINSLGFDVSCDRGKLLTTTTMTFLEKSICFSLIHEKLINCFHFCVEL